MIKEYINYIKDNPKHLWFKAKLYGYGWTPVNKEGFLVTALYLVLFFASLRDIEGAVMSVQKAELHLVFILLITALFIFICLKKGERPRWQWGSKKRK